MSAAGWLRTPARDLSPALRSWFVVGILAYSAFGAILFNHLQGRGGQGLDSIGFGYGPLIDAIRTTGKYRVEAGVHYPGVAFSAHRLPLIPYFLIALEKVAGDRLGRVAFLKCIAFNLFLCAACIVVLARSRAPIGRFVLALGFVATMPRWALNVFEIGVEEAYEIQVLALLFALLWFGRPETPSRRTAWAAALGVLLVLLLFIKSSMTYWCIAVPFLAALAERDWKPGATALAFVVAGLLGLASFNLANSGRFTIESSWEGWNLYKGNSEYTKSLYPPYSLDILDYEGKVTADRPLRDEWDFNRYFKDRAIGYIRDHPFGFFGLALRKAWIFFVEIRHSGMRLGERRMSGAANWAQLLWMAAFRAAFFWALFDAVRRLYRSPPFASEAVVPFGFVAFLILYSGFYIVGFAYERHVMPIVLPTVLYLIWTWDSQSRRLARGSLA